jgi:hypothetical protein
MIIWGGSNGSDLITGGRYCAQSTPTPVPSPVVTPRPRPIPAPRP